MIRLIRAGLARQGLGGDLKGPGPGAHVPLASKRAALRRILDEHGPTVLLRIGEALTDLGDEPTLAVMERATTPEDVIARWRRLERYVHSRHRIEVLSSAPRRLVLRHFAVGGADPPLREEDLLIFGLMVALVGWIGAVGLRARPGGETDWAFDGRWIAAPETGESAVWVVEWDRVAPGRTAAGSDDGRWTLAGLLRDDLTRRWTIDAAARELGRSTRSLQRVLQRRGKTFSQVVADTRAAAAVRLLDADDRGLAEIGFLCGYADQAHFTRSFRAAMATTPRAFRMNAHKPRPQGAHDCP